MSWVSAYFNSNLVRLKESERLTPPEMREPFQFQSGAIKGYGFLGWQTAFSNFNSNLVRLKAR